MVAKLPLVISVLLTTGGLQAQAPSQDKAAELDTLLTRYAAHGFSGTVLVAIGGDIVFEKGYGMADRARGIPNTPDTRYDMASIAKTFTGAAILALESEGKLSTTDRLERHIGSLPEAKSAATVHQLASHRAGLAASLQHETGDSDRSVFVRAMADAPIDSPPGAQYRYSNAGFCLLAAVVEIAADEPFEAYVRRILIEPTGLDNTVFLSEIDPDDRSVAQGYFDATANAAPPPYAYGWGTIGATGVVSTVGDIYRWYAAMRAGSLLPAAQREKQFDGSETEAYGWHVDTRNGRARVHKGGGLSAMQAQIMAYPDDDVVIVWAHNNTGRSWRGALNQGISAIALGEDYFLPPEGGSATSSLVAGRYVGSDDTQVDIHRQGETVSVGRNTLGLQRRGQLIWTGEVSFAYFDPDAIAVTHLAVEGVDSERMLMVTKPDGQTLRLRWKSPPPPDVRLTSATLDRYVGVYELRPGFDFQVSREGDRLNLSVSGQGTLVLIPESKTVFSLSGVDAGVTFVVDPDGRVDQLIFRQSGRDRPAKRKQTP